VDGGAVADPLAYRRGQRSAGSRRLSRPTVRQREERLTRFLEDEIWPLIPPDQLGKPLSKAEREQILGFGEDGV
jgi:antitoxin VapB